MKVVILCGGMGTRIRDVSNDIPKPMIPIGDKPILWHIMKYYSYWDHVDFILCLGYKGYSIKNFFINYDLMTQDQTITLGNEQAIVHNNHNENWNISLIDTGLKSMTGSRISKIKKYIGEDETFFLTYGDGVSDIDINKLLEFHLSHGKILTVSGVFPPARFGELKTSENGLVHGFNEKPQTEGGRINGGFFVCNRKIFNYLNDDENLVFEHDPINKIVKDKEMMMYKHDGFWQPMDTSREFNLLNKLYNENIAPWITK